MKNLFKNLKPKILIRNVGITLIYPLARAFMAEHNKLQVFADILTIFALALIVIGIIYALVLKGDFDISGFVFNRGMRRTDMQNYGKYKRIQDEKREAAFNYPLFLGIAYLIVSAVIVYCFV